MNKGYFYKAFTMQATTKATITMTATTLPTTVMEAINATFPSDSDVLSSVEIEKKVLFFIQAVQFTFIVKTKWPCCEMIQTQVFSR